MLSASGSAATAQVGRVDVEQEFQLAAGFYQRGQWKQAAAAFESLIKLHAGTTQADVAHFFLGEALMQQQDYQRAYLSWQNYLLRLPNHEFSARAMFRMGEAAMQMKLLPQSIRLFEDFVQQHPHDSLIQFALASLGEMRLTRQEPQLAERVFERALSIKPAGHIANQCRYGLARSLQLQGDTADALNFYQFIIDEPGNTLAEDARLQAGIIAFANQQHDLAADYLRGIGQRSESFQTRGEATYWLGRLAIERNEFKVAARLFSTIDTDEVSNDLAAATFYDGAVAAWQAGDNELADRLLQRLLDEHQQNDLTDDALRMQILMVSQAGKHRRAKTLCETFLSEQLGSPFATEVREIAGRAAYATEDFHSTISHFESLLGGQAARDPGRNATWAYHLALGQLGLERYRAAEQTLATISLRDVAANEPDAAEALRSRVEIALATANFAQQKFSSSVPHYENYLQYVDVSTDPAGVRQAQLELTLAYAHSNDWQAASKQFDDWAFEHKDPVDVAQTAKTLAAMSTSKEAAEFQPHWYRVMAKPSSPAEVAAIGLSGLGWLAKQRGDDAAATAAFDELLMRCPKHPLAAQAAIARGKALESEQNFAAAAEAYAIVTSGFPDTDLARVALLRRAYSLKSVGSKEALTQAQEALDTWMETVNQQAVDRDLMAEALYQAGWISHDLGDLAARDRRFNRLSNGFQNSKYWPDAVYRLACSRASDKQFDSAIEGFQQLLRAKNVPPRIQERARYRMAQLLIEQKQWASAEAMLRPLVNAASDLKLSDKATYWLAECLYRQDKFTEVVGPLRPLHDRLKDQSGTLQPWIALRLAQSLGKESRWADAAKVAQPAAGQFPKFFLAHEFAFLNGRALEHEGRLVDAMKVYQRVVDSKTGRNSETAAMAQWRIGEVFFHQEKFTEAIAAYYRVDSLYDFDRWRSAALLQAGKCQEHLGNLKHAEKLYRQLVTTFPSSDLVGDANERLEQLPKLIANRPTTQKDERH